MASQLALGWADYVVFAVILVVSIVIGLIPACTGGKQRTTAEYISGNRQLRLFPVAVSLLVTYMSGVTLLGAGTETYFFGAHYMVWMLGHIAGAVFTMLLYVPLLYPLAITSTNEYFELRFGSRVLTLFGTLVQVLDLVILNAFALLSSALVFNTVADFPIWASILLMGVISTFYTALGGIKAVVWTDVFQACIMIAGLLAVIIQGTISTGGPSETWRLYREGGRLSLDFVPSPFKRLDFWSVGLLQSPMWAFQYGVLQMGVQRFNSLPTYRHAMTSIGLLIPMNLIMLTVCGVTGIVAYGYYASVGCDPYLDGNITNLNQIIPYLVLDILGYPGLPGFFFAAIFCGSLSNLSSALAAMASFVWRDVLQKRFSAVKEVRKTLITKGLVIVFGILSIACGFLFANVGGTLVQMTISIHIIGVVPVGVLLTLGACTPRTNRWSAGIGSVLSLFFLMWLSSGVNLFRTNQSPLPTITDNCTAAQTFVYNMSTVQPFSGTTPAAHMEVTSGNMEPPPSGGIPYGLQQFYSISYAWFACLGSAVGIIVGLLLSFIPGLAEKEPVEERYIFVCLRPFWRRFAPGRVTRGHKDVYLVDQQAAPDPVDHVMPSSGETVTVSNNVLDKEPNIVRRVTRL